MKNRKTPDLAAYMTVDEFLQAIHDETEKVVEKHLTPPSPFETFTLAEAADLLKTHRDTLRLYAEKGLIDSFRIGNRYMFTLDAVQKFVSNKGSSQPTRKQEAVKVDE